MISDPVTAHYHMTGVVEDFLIFGDLSYFMICPACHTSFVSSFFNDLLHFLIFFFDPVVA